MTVKIPYFYRTADVAELDLMVVSGLEVKVAIEIKLSNAPTKATGGKIKAACSRNHPGVKTPDRP